MKRFSQVSLLVLSLAALAGWTATGAYADPITPPGDHPVLVQELPIPAAAVPMATGTSAEVSVAFSTTDVQVLEGTFGPLPLPAAPSIPQHMQDTCRQLLLNPELDVIELGDGTGRAEPWVIYTQIVYYTDGTYVSPQYSLSVKDADSGDETPTQDAFAQAFYMPDNLTSVTIHYYTTAVDANTDDRALGNLWTVDADGELVDYLGSWEVGDSPSGWQGQTVPITDPAALAPMEGQRMAIILFNQTDGAEPGERVRFDDVTLTACTVTPPTTIYLPLVLRSYGVSTGPVCRPPTENPQDTWDANRGYTEADAICDSTLSRIDLADYYTFVPPVNGDYTLHLRNLPAGTEWAAHVYVDQAAYPPPYAPGPATNQCRIDIGGSGDKSVTCPLDGGKGYFVKVSAGASYTGPEGGYQMQIVSPSGPSPSPSPTPEPTGPKPGFWDGGTGVEFYVTTDRAKVDDFAIYINVPGCGSYKITHNPEEPITNNTFSFSGSFYASGTFNSETTASGTTGLDHFYIPGCGYVTGGPYSWTATWQSSSQPTMPTQVLGPERVEPVSQTGEFYTVVPAE